MYVCKEFYESKERVRDAINKKTQKKDPLTGKIYLIVTYVSHPNGGGEEFMYDTMEWASDLGMKCFWISFFNKTDYTTLEIISEKYGTMIHVPGGFCPQVLDDWINLIQPDIIHHQGCHRGIMFEVAKKYNIMFVTGFHFWTGGLLLGPTSNTKVIENAHLHQADPEFEYMYNDPNIVFYTASQYVKDCFTTITGRTIEDTIFAASSPMRTKIDDCDRWCKPSLTSNDGFVTMVNIHRLKGGEILLQLVERCTDIKFLCIQTEGGSGDLDKKIELAMKSRNVLSAPCIYMSRTKDMKSVYSKTKIALVGSLVDETFCRAVNEPMMNGIPVLSTHYGNIKHLIGDVTKKLDPDDIDSWESEIRKLYFDEDYYREISRKTLCKYEEASFEKAREQFKGAIVKATKRSKDTSVAFFVPWCDQGLGIQARNYHKLLRETHLKLSIFAFKPYNADSCLALQKEPSEWEADNIYYSPNSRESVEDDELLEFCREYNVGKMIIPETCWDRTFQVAKLLKNIGVKTYAIPNIEIVRRDELYKHEYFHKILANNNLCQRVFSKLNIPVEYIGYGTIDIEFKPKVFDNDEIKFLFVGGMNAFSRKHVLTVCEAFVQACKTCDNIFLTASIQKTTTMEQSAADQIRKYESHPRVNLIQDHLKYSEIINFYHTHHVSIQVSKQEGLGLGFYEALSSGTPVITLDTPPHNEIIIHDHNGWVLDCFYKEMTDNGSPLFGAAYFFPENLTKVITCINKDTILKLQANIKEKREEAFLSYKERFINALT